MIITCFAFSVLKACDTIERKKPKTMNLYILKKSLENEKESRPLCMNVK